MLFDVLGVFFVVRNLESIGHIKFEMYITFMMASEVFYFNLLMFITTY